MNPSPASDAAAYNRRNYLNSPATGLRSWLTTRDHKRIVVMFLVATTIAFALGGFFALLIRLELLTPGPTIMDAMTYNRLFTLHGVVMIFLFMIPAIPSGFGNFLVPIMLGAKDVAFPRINLLSFYLYVLGAAVALYGMVHGGADTGWTFYAPYSTTTVTMVDLRDGGHPDPRDAGDRDDGSPRRGRARLQDPDLRPGAGRRPGAVPALLLVLLAPRRLHHYPPGDGGDLRGGLRVLAQEHLRLQGGGLLLARHRLRRLLHVGSPPLHVGPVADDGRHLRGPLDVRGDLHGREGVQLDGDAVPRLDRVPHPVRLLRGVPVLPRLRGHDRHRARDDVARRPLAGHLLRRRALPLHHGRRDADGVPRRASLLAAEDHRPDVLGGVGARRRGDGGARLQLHLHPAVPARERRDAAPLLLVPGALLGAERRLDGGRVGPRHRALHRPRLPPRGDPLGPDRGPEPLGLARLRVGHALAAAPRELRDDSGLHARAARVPRGGRPPTRHR